MNNANVKKFVIKKASLDDIFHRDSYCVGYGTVPANSYTEIAGCAEPRLQVLLL